jgi:hypothetical protein
VAQLRRVRLPYFSLVPLQHDGLCSGFLNRRVRVRLPPGVPCPRKHLVRLPACHAGEGSSILLVGATCSGCINLASRSSRDTSGSEVMVTKRLPTPQDRVRFLVGPLRGCSSSGERFSGREEVVGSIPTSSTRRSTTPKAGG